jgi:hypothetical protein
MDGVFAIAAALQIAVIAAPAFSAFCAPASGSGWRFGSTARVATILIVAMASAWPCRWMPSRQWRLAFRGRRAFASKIAVAQMSTCAAMQQVAARWFVT